MLKIIKIILLVMVSKTAFSFMTEDDAKQELTSMIETIQSDLLGGEPFCTFEGYYTVVPAIVMESTEKILPNASLTPISENEMGILVNTSLLAIEDRNSILFTLAHELGHAYTEVVLREIDCLGLDGMATEVVADLSAVLFLNAIGIDLDAISESTSQWQVTNIFDFETSGDHPAGEERHTWIATTIDRLKHGELFIDIVRDIVKNRLAAHC